MNALWEGGPQTVGEVAAALPIAYTTVLTTLRILEQKRYVRRKKQGRGHVYEAAVERQAAQRSTVKHLVDRLFGGSHGSLVLNVIEDSPLSDDELAQLQRMIEERRK